MEAGRYCGVAPIYIYTKVAPVDIYTARALIEPVATLATYTAPRIKPDLDFLLNLPCMGNRDLT